MINNNTDSAFAAFERAREEAAEQAVRSSSEPAEDSNKSESRGERGFAAMDPNLQKEIARKGGAAVSRNREHMAQIGRKGGESVSKNREHMSTIGRKGGKSGGESRAS